LVYGSEQGKTQATRFVQSVVATGSTRHMKALRLALALTPDVLFFLTDAEDPTLSEEDLRQIRRMNRGTSINAIEFGFGPSTGNYNFLRKLAAQNGGKHAYVDISQLKEN
jgi:hypothetical protein